MTEESLFALYFNTNFSNHKDVESMYRSVFTNIYASSYKESRVSFYILMAILLACSIIGTLANLLVLIIFKFIFNTQFNRKIESKLVSSVNSATDTKVNLNGAIKITEESSMNNAYKGFINNKNQLIYNPNLRNFFTITQYLAIIDLLTSSFAIPTTTFEIWNNMNIGEFSCKLFEFMRATGVIASDFLIILIAIERYMASCNLYCSKVEA